MRIKWMVAAIGLCMSIALLFHCGTEKKEDTEQSSVQQVSTDPAQCGNGVVEQEETCDDGNTADGDGCSSTCTIEIVPDISPVCGNGTLEGGEECDDGNTVDHDGCSATCQRVCTRNGVYRGETDQGLTLEMTVCNGIITHVNANVKFSQPDCVTTKGCLPGGQISQELEDLALTIDPNTCEFEYREQECKGACGGDCIKIGGTVQGNTARGEALANYKLFSQCYLTTGTIEWELAFVEDEQPSSCP